jgi:hypothetical protein
MPLATSIPTASAEAKAIFATMSVTLRCKFWLIMSLSQFIRFSGDRVSLALCRAHAGLAVHVDQGGVPFPN